MFFRRREDEMALARTLGLSLLVLILTPACGDDATQPEEITPPPVVDRHAAIPADVRKVTPEEDAHPPILHSVEFHEPVPLPGISTAGAEDSPFIPEGGEELYFFFAADIREDPSVQVQNPVNGIWLSNRKNGVWGKPELVWLQEYDLPALNGCPFVDGDEMWFCTARVGLTGLHWFRAHRVGGVWTNWRVSDFPSGDEVGELHIYEDELYYGSARPGGMGGQDIWMLPRRSGFWWYPENVSMVNTDMDETLPFVTFDGKELWFTRWHEGSPAIMRSKRMGGGWDEPELIVSRFAGEPTLDPQGNLYFVHHFYEDGVMLEADIYVAYRK